MPGHARTTLTAVAPPKNTRKAKRRDKRRRAVADLKQLLNVYDMEMPATLTSLPDVLDECLRRAVGDMRYAGAQVDQMDIEDYWVTKLDAQGNTLVEPHPWVQLERSLREEVVDIASRCMGLDLDARRVALAEAQAALLQRALKTAMEQLNLTKEQRKELGPALRNARAIIEGTAEEVPAA